MKIPAMNEEGFLKMTDQKYWPCEHIKFNNRLDVWEIFWPDSRSKAVVYKQEMFCTFCGAKRPQEQKDWLYELILKSYKEWWHLKPEMTVGEFCRYAAKAIRAEIKANGPKLPLIDQFISPNDESRGREIQQIKWIEYLGISGGGEK